MTVYGFNEDETQTDGVFCADRKKKEKLLYIAVSGCFFNIPKTFFRRPNADFTQTLHRINMLFTQTDSATYIYRTKIKNKERIMYRIIGDVFQRFFWNFL